MSTFQLTWSMYGVAEVEAASLEEAKDSARNELMSWSGFGTDFDDLDVDGCEVSA